MSCSLYSFNGVQIKYDTIKPIAKLEINSDSCLTKVNSYYNFNGIYISEYYNIMDTLKIDLNNDKENDYLLVLSPLSLDIAELWYSVDQMPKRLLVEIIMRNGVSKVRNIYQNIIPNEGLLLMSYNSIIKTKNGFPLIIQKGNRYSIDYNLNFVVKENNILLQSINKQCILGMKKRISKYKYKNYEINRINIMDTIDINCNCRKDWELLEMKK